MTDCCSEESPPRAMGKMSSQHYGSFYLRIGAVGIFLKELVLEMLMSFLIRLRIFSFRSGIDDLLRIGIRAVFRDRSWK